jgi:hypothetical protein
MESLAASARYIRILLSHSFTTLRRANPLAIATTSTIHIGGIDMKPKYGDYDADDFSQFIHFIHSSKPHMSAMRSSGQPLRSIVGP